MTSTARSIKPSSRSTPNETAIRGTTSTWLLSTSVPCCLLLDHDPRRRAPRAVAGQRPPDLPRDLPVDPPMRPVRVDGHHRPALVRRLADGHGERHLAEERHAEAGRL